MASDANWLSPSLLHVNNLCPDQDKHYSTQTFVVFGFENENDILRFFFLNISLSSYKMQIKKFYKKGKHYIQDNAVILFVVCL